ncbi:N-acetylmuramoyl-L-alanine amidase [Candidatus Pacearchaeota archaeon]|nr:N-acetylmuramoyl-L-alanine amidase [Candidatus Pacearchaeota archaeon]
MKPKKIFIHCSSTTDSGTVSWGPIRHYHIVVKGWSDIGYHYGIELINSNYEILIGRFDYVQGAHCKGQNKNTIGICFIGDFDFKAPTNSMIKKGISLVKHLMKIHGISVDNIYGHNEFDKNKTCPGKYFNMDKFRELLIQ